MALHFLFSRAGAMSSVLMVMDLGLPKIKSAQKSIGPRQVAAGVAISCLTILLVLLLCVSFAYLSLVAMNSV